MPQKPPFLRGIGFWDGDQSSRMRPGSNRLGYETVDLGDGLALAPPAGLQRTTCSDEIEYELMQQDYRLLKLATSIWCMSLKLSDQNNV
jgi:hypothetical protein